MSASSARFRSVGIASAMVGLALLAISGAPRELVAMLAAMIALGVAALLITLAWKISVHTAVVAGALAVGTLVFGPGLLILTVVVALVGWARVEVGAHSPAQAVAGAVLGALLR